MGTRLTMMRRERTEHAKAVRRQTGTNGFADKQLTTSKERWSGTITASQSKDNLLLVEYEEQ